LALKILGKNSNQWGIYTPPKKLAVGAEKQLWRLAVDRPGRPPTVKNLTVGASVDRPNPESNFVLWTVDRSVDRALLTVDRPVDRPHPRVGDLQSVNRAVDRLKYQPNMHKFVHVGRPVRSTVSGSGRPSRSTARAWQKAFWVRKTWFKIF